MRCFEQILWTNEIHPDNDNAKIEVFANPYSFLYDFEKKCERKLKNWVRNDPYKYPINIECSAS